MIDYKSNPEISLIKRIEFTVQPFLTVYQSSLLTYSPLMYRFLELYHIPVWTYWTSFNESEIRNINPYCLNRAVNLMNTTLVAASCRVKNCY